jgi:glycoside/pentoside/hexuronide:cation symporter, GPH family
VSEAGAGQRPRLGWPTKALYGMGALGTAVRGALMGGAVLFFYNRIPDGPSIDAKLVGLAILISLLIDAFWDPVVGQISDHTRTRLGRRHPFIYAGVLPASVFFALIFMPPLDWSEGGLFFYLLATLILARLLESIVEIPAASLLPELSKDYDERTGLNSWRYVFSAVIGRVVATVLSFGVFLRGTAANHGFGQMNLDGYAPYAITAAVISVVVTILSALSTQRFVPFMHQPPQRRPGFVDMAREIWFALGNRNFFSLAASGLIFGVAIGITGGLQLYFTTDFWQLGSSALFQFGLWAVLGSLVGVFAAPYWAKRMGKKLGCLTVFYCAILCTTIPIGLRLLGLMPPNSSPWVLRILIVDNILTGFFSITGFIIVTSMLADVVEEVAVKSGRRSEGVLFAGDSLLRKVTTAFASGLPAFLLDYVHYPRHIGAGKVPWPVLFHLAIIYLPLVTVLYLCSTSVLMLYRIDRARHEDNLERLAQAAALEEQGDPQLNPHPVI